MSQFGTNLTTIPWTIAVVKEELNSCEFLLKLRSDAGI